ncbi:MAG TPA: CDP-alcohol phosphatidyltransferase family protein [Rhizobiales bacterium]|nr:CDP-alcohol phosphatidyltransferase family protein [Hyphomicrobiales bacterium]
MTEHQFTPALCIVGDCATRLWALTPPERLRKQFARTGINETITLAEAEKRNGPVIFVRADVVIDQPVIPVLVKRLNLALAPGDAASDVPVAVTTNGQSARDVEKILAGEMKPEDLKLLVRKPSDLDAAYWEKLRKKEVPYVLTVDADKKDDLEWRMFMGTYKGATDFITRHVWPRPAFVATRAIAPTFITPNMVTFVSAIMVVLAFWWFMNGQYAIGLVAAWMMTFLDTVDGKLARTTLTASHWGDIFDHGIDLIHPPFWYYAWGAGLGAAGFHWSNAFFWQVFAVIMGGYVLQRIMEGIAIKWLGIEIHIWRPVDTWFRKITARRNPNLFILTLSVLIGRPDWGLIAVAVWTAICLVIHAIQLVHAFMVKPAGKPLVSWMRQPGMPK